MDEAALRAMIDAVSAGELAPDDAVARLRRLPFADLGDALVDHHRTLRQGAPEAVYGPGKTAEQCVRIVGELLEHGTGPVLLTRAGEHQVKAVLAAHGDAEQLGGCVLWRRPPVRANRRVLVATAGTALTPEHLGLLGQVTSTVTLAFDGDQGGRLAVAQAADHAGGHPLRLHVAQVPEDQDPADLLRSDPAIFEEALAEAVPIAHHLITEVVRKHNLDEPEGVARAVHYAGQLVAAMQDRDQRDQAVELIASLVGRPESAVRRYIGESLQASNHRRVREQGLSVM